MAGADSAGSPNEQACSAAACTKGCTTAFSNSKIASQAFVRRTYYSVLEYGGRQIRFSVIALTLPCLANALSCGATDPREQGHLLRFQGGCLYFKCCLSSGNQCSFN